MVMTHAVMAGEQPPRRGTEPYSDGIRGGLRQIRAHRKAGRACLGVCELAEGEDCVLMQLSVHLCYGLIAAHLAILQALGVLLHVAAPVLYRLRMH